MDGPPDNGRRTSGTVPFGRPVPHGKSFVPRLDQQRHEPHLGGPAAKSFVLNTEWHGDARHKNEVPDIGDGSFWTASAPWQILCPRLDQRRHEPHLGGPAAKFFVLAPCSAFCCMVQERRISQRGRNVIVVERNPDKRNRPQWTGRRGLLALVHKRKRDSGQNPIGHGKAQENEPQREQVPLSGILLRQCLNKA